MAPVAKRPRGGAKAGTNDDRDVKRRRKTPLPKPAAAGGGASAYDVLVSGTSSVVGVKKRVLHLLEDTDARVVTIRATGKAVATACRAYAEVKLEALVAFDVAVSIGTAQLGPAGGGEDGDGDERRGSSIVVQLTRAGERAAGLRR